MIMTSSLCHEIMASVAKSGIQLLMPLKTRRAELFLHVKSVEALTLQIALLYDRWQHHLPPQFSHGTRGEENILQSPAPVVSAVTSHKTYGPTDLTVTYSVCTRRTLGSIRHRTQTFRSGARCSNH
ncbi:uncharacterized protein TNCV_1867481 [Trichonephila clavipes]|nr:uncharacterized protein TNCV_1867481 [Trichonephila clavipes]